MKHFFNSISKLLLSLLALTAITSCKDSEEPNDSNIADVTMSISVDTSMFNYLGSNSERSETRGDAMQLRYIVYLYNADETKPFEIKSSHLPILTFNLPLGDYHAIAWADYVPNGTDSDFYFNTDDPDNMLLANKPNYKGNDAYKMAFCNDVNFTVLNNTPSINLTLKPQMAQFTLFASDSPDYEVGKIRVSYPKTVPAAIHADSHEVCDYLSGISYQHTYQTDFVTMDNVFANDVEQEINVKIEVYDTNGKVRARRLNIPIPIKKGGFTKAKTKIYSVLESDSDNPSGGGIGINPDFDETIEILY